MQHSDYIRSPVATPLGHDPATPAQGPVPGVMPPPLAGAVRGPAPHTPHGGPRAARGVPRAPHPGCPWVAFPPEAGRPVAPCGLLVRGSAPHTPRSSARGAPLAHPLAFGSLRPAPALPAKRSAPGSALARAAGPAPRCVQTFGPYTARGWIRVTTGFVLLTRKSSVQLFMRKPVGVSV